MKNFNYIIISILAICLGQVVRHLCKKMPAVVSEKITYKEYYKTLFKDFKFDMIVSIIQLILFNLLMYYLENNLTTYLYCITVSVLIIVFYIDFKYQLIPDEAHIALIIISAINIVFHANMWYDYLLGGLIGGLIFYILGQVALLIYKKEGMGFGDVKLMASLGFLFGIKNILVITLISFFIGAAVGIILLISKKKNKDSYIPFGPFIVIATILLMFVKADDIIFIYISFCAWLGTKITDVIYFFVK